MFLTQVSYFDLSLKLSFNLSDFMFFAELCCLFIIGNFVMVDSPRFPKSSGIDPKKALIKMD